MTVFGGTLVARPWKKKVGRVEHGAPDLPFRVVGDRGFEPLTSSVSRKRSPPELIARGMQTLRGGDRNRTGVRGFAGLCLTTRPPRRNLALLYLPTRERPGVRCVAGG